MCPKTTGSFFRNYTVNIDTGETKFASTLEEHAENVDEYQQWCSENEDKCQ